MRLNGQPWKFLEVFFIAICSGCPWHRFSSYPISQDANPKEINKIFPLSSFVWKNIFDRHHHHRPTQAAALKMCLCVYYCCSLKKKAAHRFRGFYRKIQFLTQMGERRTRARTSHNSNNDNNILVSFHLQLWMRNHHEMWCRYSFIVAKKKASRRREELYFYFLISKTQFSHTSEPNIDCVVGIKWFFTFSAQQVSFSFELFNTLNNSPSPKVDRKQVWPRIARTFRINLIIATTNFRQWKFMNDPVTLSLYIYIYTHQ